MSKLEVNAVEPQSGTTVTLGASGDTITIPSGATLNTSNATVNLPSGISLPSGSVTNTQLATTVITGQTAETSIDGGDSVLIYDDSASALRKMTRTNFVSGLGAAAGQVIQVVSATDSTERATTSATFNDITGMTVSITPSSASNKVFIIASGASGVDGSGIAYYTILKDSTNLGDATDGMAISRGNSASSYPNVAMNYLDSPATTSATTYKLQFRSTSGTTNAFFNKDGCKGSITVMEIKG